MRAARALFLLFLLSLPSFAASTKVVPAASPTPRRYRIGDTERPRHIGFIARIENCLPVALLIFLGFRGNVQVSGDVGNVSVSAGSSTSR